MVNYCTGNKWVGKCRETTAWILRIIAEYFFRIKQLFSFGNYPIIQYNLPYIFLYIPQMF